MTVKRSILILSIIGLLVYLNSLFNGFVWDDEEQVLNNVLVHSITNLPAFFSGSTFNTGGSGNLGGLYYKPLMTVFFSLIYTIFGPNPFFFHLLQVMFHLANTVLVFLLLRHFLKSNVFLPFTMALIFLIHPINSEAVVYISALQDTLFFFFGILALLLCFKNSLQNFKSAAIVTCLLTLSLLSKETGVIFIATTIIYALLFKRKDIVPYAVTSFIVLGIYSFLRFVVAEIFFNKHGLAPISVMPLLERLQSAPKITVNYLQTFLFPKDLAISQHWVVKSADFTNFYLPLILTILFMGVLVSISVIIRKRYQSAFLPYLFFLIWFLAGLGLHLQIFPLDLTISDRWFYMPMVGVLGMTGIIMNQLKVQSKKLKVIIGIFLISIITMLSVRTMVRNTDWKNGLTLYGHDVQISKDSFDLENNFGVELYRAGKYEEAESRFIKSTGLAPSWWINWNNLGATSERKGDYKKAKEYYQKAVDNGSYYLAYENLASIYLFRDNDPEEARKFTESSLQKLPLNSKLWLIMAISEYQLGHSPKALEASKQAYALNPTQETYYVYSRLSQNLPLELK